MGRRLLWIAPFVAFATGCPSSSGPDGGGGDAGVDSGSPATDGGGCDWPQFAHDSTHSSHTCATAQTPNRILATFLYDPFVAQEQWETYYGDLNAHYASPLLVGDDVYMMKKWGQYVDCDPPLSGPFADGGYTGLTADGGLCGPYAWSSEIWDEVRLHWENGALVQQWGFVSDWTPVPALLTDWEPPFQAAVFGNVLYVPGAGGTVHEVDRMTGVEVQRVNPFPADGGVDPNTYLLGGIAVDGQGNAYYNAVTFDPASVYNDVTGYLVRIAASGAVTVATYQSLVPSAPAATDLCDSDFATYVFDADAGNYVPVLLPPPDDGGQPVYAPQTPCQSQRAGVNSTPAIGPDGTVYIVSRAHLNAEYSYFAAVHPDLTPSWQVSFRGYLDDGCGLTIPADALPDGTLADGGYGFNHCRTGAAQGVDPLTNKAPAAHVDDSSSATPLVFPDGTVGYGALTTYNNDRGHFLKLNSSGIQASYDFGWDVTPAFYSHDGTFSIVIKDNHYFYWDGSPSQYFVTQLSPSLQPEWKFQNTNPNDCVRLEDGGVSCIPNPSGPGFEWCISAPATDAANHVFGNAEDGNLYVLGSDGGLESQFFLQLALGAAYTPVALDSQGRIYALNGGVMSVLGQ